MAVIHNVTLDVDKRRFCYDQAVHVRVGDKATQTVAASLKKDGAAYTPSSGSTAKLEVLKHDNTWSVSNATISGSLVTGTLPLEAISCPGECKRAYFRIINSGGTHEDTTEDFYLYVFPNATQDAIESRPYTDQLDELIAAASQELQDTIDEVQALRTSYDGTTYASASAAVNTKMEQLANMVGPLVPVAIQTEIGNININDGQAWTYSASQTRVRTPNGYSVHLYPGDSFRFAEYDKMQRVYYGYHDETGYHCPEPNWIGREVVVEHEGDYVFNMRATVDGTSLSGDDLVAAVSNFEIIHRTNLNGDVKDAIDELDTDIAKLLGPEILLDTRLEIGSITIYDGRPWTYSAGSGTRARTARNYMLHLMPGDTILFAEHDRNQKMYYGYLDDDGYHCPQPGWIDGPVNVQHEGDYVICLRATVDGTALTGDELMDAVSCLEVHHRSNLVGDVRVAIDGANARIDDVEASIASVLDAAVVEHSETYWSVAHQGYKYTAPKSTAAACVEARRKGYRYVENDHRKSGDGKSIMWHDEHLGACGALFDVNGYTMYTDGTDYYGYDDAAGNLYKLGSDGTYTASSEDVQSLSRLQGGDVVVSQTNLAVLKHFDVGRYVSMEFAGEAILTFEDWVLVCKKLGLRAYVDRKVDWGSNIAGMVEYARRLGMLENLSWCCGTAGGGISVRTHDPEARILVFGTPTDAALEYYGALQKGRGITFFMSEEQATEENCQRAYDNGYDVDCWYVGIESVAQATVFATINELLARGVKGFVLDRYLVGDAIDM